MTLTRRQVFQTGALAGLAKLLWGNCDHFETDLMPGMALWAGDATQRTVEITGYTGNVESGGRVGLITALNEEMTDGVVDYPPAVHNPSGFNKWSVDRLQPGTTYWYRLLVNGVRKGPLCKFRTLRPVGVPCEITIAVGGCKRDDASDAAFRDIVAWVPDRVMNLGDMGYPRVLTTDPATHEANWARQLVNPPMKQIQAQGCVDYIASDHDTTGGADNPPDFDNPVSAANLRAWADMVPARMADPRRPRRARYRSEVEGNVRFVKLDTRNQDRTDVRNEGGPPIPPSDPNSTMLGRNQLDWLYEEIDQAAAAGQFLCIFSDPGWYGTAEIDGDFRIKVSNSDKWIAYIHERNLISDYIAAAYAAVGKGVNALVICSDTHALQQDNGAHQRNGLASVVCGPFDQNIHALATFVESYEWTYPAHADEHRQLGRQQSYQRLTFREAPAGTLTVTAVARDCTPIGGAVSRRTMRKTYLL